MDWVAFGNLFLSQSDLSLLVALNVFTSLFQWVCGWMGYQGMVSPSGVFAEIEMG